MSVIPNTVCPRCHREYPSFRARCPYCGTRKPREVKRSVPESDSAVRGTTAARQAAEAVNWQMLVGGILLVCIIATVIAIVSVNLSRRVDEMETTIAVEETQAEREVAAETTAVPTATPIPTPTPTPAPTITSISITSSGYDMSEGFMEPAGSTIQLEVTVYPLMEDIEVTWSSTDESCATVDENGLVTVVGGYGSYCEIVATVGDREARCPVWGR